MEGKKKNEKMKSPPTRRTMGTWVRNNKQKAHLFAESLAKILNPNIINEEANLEYTENHVSRKIRVTTSIEVENETKQIQYEKSKN